MEFDYDAGKIVVNIFISFIGAGVLGLPYAFKEAGLFEGTIVMIFVAVFSVKAMLLLIECKYKTTSVLGKPLNHVRVNQGKDYAPLKTNDAMHSDEDYDDDDDENGKRKISRSNSPSGYAVSKGHVTYGDVAFSALGHIGRYSAELFLMASQLGFCCGYLFYVAENIITYYPSMTKSTVLALVCPLMVVLGCLPSLSSLALFSLVAQCSNLLAFGVVFWFDFDHLHLVSARHRKEFDVTKFPMFFSTAIYCFEGAGMILSLEQSTPDRLRPAFNKFFMYTLVAVTLLYISFGTSGYLSFGPETKDLITMNLPPVEGGFLDFAKLVKFCLGVALLLTYPVMMFPVTTLIEQKIVTLSVCIKDNKFLRVAIVFVLVSITGIVVISLPNFTTLMTIIGATCCTTLAFVMPAMCHLALFRAELTQSQRCIDYFLIFLGVAGAVTPLVMLLWPLLY